MTSLPRHLSPWAAHLALFPHDIALGLGALVSRLSTLIGSGHVGRAAEGTPDGYDGIAQRGSYERLLATEWLLLDEMPDEFLRRAISSEHTFLRRAHANRTAGRRCTVLFDAGSEQLGAPRLAHLALLIVLAQRANEQRATFGWGVLQDVHAQLHSAVTETSVLELLRARCARVVSAADLERWTAATEGE